MLNKAYNINYYEMKAVIRHENSENENRYKFDFALSQWTAQ